MTGSMNFGMSSPYIEAFGMARGAAAKIFGVIDNQPVINASKGNGHKPSSIRGQISFKNVHFEYPSRPDVKVIEALNRLKFQNFLKIFLLDFTRFGLNYRTR